MSNAQRMRDWRNSLSEQEREELRLRERAYAAKRYVERPEWAKDRLLRQFHKITLVEFLERVNKQDGRCAICGILLETSRKERSSNKACMDHDHETNRLRGVLCSSCNRALGFFRDSVVILEAALKYLKYWKEIS
jgi:ribosomal protein L34E